MSVESTRHWQVLGNCFAETLRRTGKAAPRDAVLGYIRGGRATTRRFKESSQGIRRGEIP